MKTVKHISALIAICALIIGCAGTPISDEKKALDIAAVNALLKAEHGVPYEVVTEVVSRGELAALPFEKSGLVGGTYRIREPQNVAAILHTHPYFDVTVSAHLDFDWRQANELNKAPGPHDSDLVKRLGIPNYYRTPTGSAIGVLEPAGGKVVYRLVWTKKHGFRGH